MYVPLSVPPIFRCLKIVRSSQNLAYIFLVAFPLNIFFSFSNFLPLPPQGESISPPGGLIELIDRFPPRTPPIISIKLTANFDKIWHKKKLCYTKTIYG